MKLKTISGLTTALLLTAVGQNTFATPLECGIPLDVYLATGDPVPEGIAYEYITDEDGNFILVGEENHFLGEEENFATPLECGIPLDVYLATSDPVPEGIAYEYITDEDGNFILVGEEGNPIPVDNEFSFPIVGQASAATTSYGEAFQTEVPPSLSVKGSWAERLFQSLFGFLLLS